MAILHQRIKRRFSIMRTNSKYREFAREIDEFFQNERLGRNTVFYLCHVVVGAKWPLAFSVVTEATGFNDCRQAKFPDGLIQFVCRIKCHKFCNRNAKSFE